MWFEIEFRGMAHSLIKVFLISKTLHRKMILKFDLNSRELSDNHHHLHNGNKLLILCLKFENELMSFSSGFRLQIVNCFSFTYIIYKMLDFMCV